MSIFETRYTDLQYVGKYVPRKDARGIVTGKTTFLDDFKVPNMIYGRALRCPYPHAMVKSIDISKAQAVKGVHAVLTYKDVDPEWKMGWPPQKPVLDDHLRYVGDPVAFVAADSVDIANEAIELIEVEYDLLKPAYNGWDASADDADQLYPGNFDHNEITPGFPFFQPDGPFSHLIRGDVEEGFTECDYIVEDKVEYNKMPNPLAPEPPGCIVRWDGKLDFQVWATCQGPFICKLLASFGMPPEANFKVSAFNVGGSYGNKHSMSQQVLCGVVLSMATSRPVKVFLDKTEQLLCYENRLGSQIEAKIGMDKDGYVKAVKGKWIVEAGSFSNCTQGQVGVGLGETQIIMGACKNWDMDTQLIATNRTPAGIARGYGGMELNACLNLLMCRAMQAGDFDPVEVYKKNYIKDGDQFIWRDGITWTNHGMNYADMIQKTADKFGWKNKWNGWLKPSWVSPDGKKRRGVGVALIGNADAGEDNNECYVRITPDLKGTGADVMICMDVPESGMGERASLSKMAAEILNVPYERVSITEPGQGNGNPGAFGICGSRGTITYGRPVCCACEDLRNQLFSLAAMVLKVPEDTMMLEYGWVVSKHRPELRVAWRDLIPPTLSLTGYGKHVETFGCPSCVITFIEAEVDMETGRAEVKNIVSGSDVGQIIDPSMLEMQMQGGIGSSSLDSALYEENVVDEPTGRVLTSNLIDYKWRPFNEFPEFDTEVLESQFDTFQFKAVGVAEVTGAQMAPALMQAISNAIGVNVSTYPATPDVILKAMEKI